VGTRPYLHLGTNTLATVAGLGLIVLLAQSFGLWLSVLAAQARGMLRYITGSGSSSRFNRGSGHGWLCVLPPLGGVGGRRDVTDRTLGAMTKSAFGAALVLHGIGNRYRLGRSGGGVVPVPLFGDRLDRFDRDRRRDVEDGDDPVEDEDEELRTVTDLCTHGLWLEGGQVRAHGRACVGVRACVASVTIAAARLLSQGGGERRAAGPADGQLDRPEPSG
jgi:hypothetical protein